MSSLLKKRQFEHACNNVDSDRNINDINSNDVNSDDDDDDDGAGRHIFYCLSPNSFFKGNGWFWLEASELSINATDDAFDVGVGVGVDVGAAATSRSTLDALFI